MRNQLTVVCDGSGRTAHTELELAVVIWNPPELVSGGVSISDPIWSQGAKVRTWAVDTVISATRDSPARAPGSPMRDTSKAPVRKIYRTDGGVTIEIPACPRCGRPATLLRDDTLARYVENVRNTPLAGTLNVANTGLI